MSQAMYDRNMAAYNRLIKSKKYPGHWVLLSKGKLLAHGKFMDAKSMEKIKKMLSKINVNDSLVEQIPKLNENNWLL